MAAAQDLRVAPHCSIGPVALAACLHFDVSTPNFLIQEAFAEFDVPWRNDLVGGWNPIQRRRVRTCATRPASAWSSTSEAIAEHPYVPNAFPSLWDGDWQTNFTQDRRASSRGWRGSIPCASSASRSPATSSTSPGAVAYGDVGLGRAGRASRTSAGTSSRTWPRRPGDPGYWARLYSLEVTPEHIRGVDGLVVLRPWVKRSTFADGRGRPGRDRPLGRGLRQDRPGRLHRARRGGVQRPDGAEPLDRLVRPALHAGPGQAAARAGADHARRGAGTGRRR